MVNVFCVQVSCAARSYWQRTPSVLSDFIHSDTSYFVGFRVNLVSMFTSTTFYLAVYEANSDVKHSISYVFMSARVTVGSWGGENSTHSQLLFDVNVQKLEVKLAF